MLLKEMSMRGRVLPEVSRTLIGLPATIAEAAADIEVLVMT